MWKSIALCTLALGLCACVQLGVAPTGGGVAVAQVSGTVAYAERVALPPNALIIVRLVDVSRVDAPSVTLAEQVIRAEGRQVPFAFALPYDAARIDARYSYAVQARIEVDGKLRFISDRRYAVITRDAPSQVDMVLKAVGAPPVR